MNVLIPMLIVAAIVYNKAMGAKKSEKKTRQIREAKKRHRKKTAKAEAAKRKAAEKKEKAISPSTSREMMPEEKTPYASEDTDFFEKKREEKEDHPFHFVEAYDPWIRPLIYREILDKPKSRRK